MVGDHSGGNPAKSGNRTFSEGLRSLLSGGKYTSNSKTVVTGGQTVNIQENQRSIIGTQPVDSERKGRPQNKLQNDSNNNAGKSSTQAVGQVTLQSQTERITSTAEGAKSVADRRKERSGGSDEVVVADSATATTLEEGRAVKSKNKSKKMKKKASGSQADKILSQQVCINRYIITS